MGIDFLTRGISPWGQSIFTHISWDMLWVSFFAGVVFLAAHSVYMLLSAHTKRPAAEVDALEARMPALPPRILRHGFGARVFHWIMAASMFTLLFTSFLPIVGVQFAWVTWHWIAGLVLTASILFHIVHATFVLDFWSIWVGPKDIPEFKAEMMRELGHEAEGPKPAKYPLGNRLYHLAIVVTGLVATVTGLIMMKKVQTPFLTRDPYILSDPTWGWMYVGHGVAGVALVGLTMAHVYFAIRPEKFWITKSMLFGTISRREYLEHHDPARWRVSGSEPVGGRPSEQETGLPMREQMVARCDHIEEAYEFMLAYAAQGLASDAGSSAGGQVRQFLSRLDAALTGLGDVFRGVVSAETPSAAAQFHPFIDVLDRDAQASQAAVRLVLAQPGISSQLVDNLNASIHLRALLTDIFLVDEVLKTTQPAKTDA